MKSDDFWIRRIAIVATVSLNQKARGGKGDVKRTLEICKIAVADHEDMINKALSWALRELTKIDKEPVKEFIEKYKDELHPRVIREVNNKLKTGTKLNTYNKSLHWIFTLLCCIKTNELSR